MNRILMLLVALIAFGIHPTFAAAVNATANWVPPTTRVDGTTLPASEIAGYLIYVAVDGDVATDPAAEHYDVSSELTHQIKLDLMPRPKPYTVQLAVRTKTTDGQISDLSVPGFISVQVKSTATPGAPTSVSIELNCTDGCVITNVE